MTIVFQATADIVTQAHQDLTRPHPFAAERVGFLLCSSRTADDGQLLVVANRWMSVNDDHYIDNPRVGACIGPPAFRKILEIVYASHESVLHVHRHEHRGAPAFSRVDMRSMLEFVPSFFNASPRAPHGGIVLSYDKATGAIWDSRDARPKQISHFHIVTSSPH